MARRMLVVSVAVALLAPGLASGGFVLGARGGWAIPGGDLTEGAKVSDQIDGQVPIWVDLGWTVADQLTLGAYVRFAPNVRDSSAIDRCDLVDADCGGYGLGAGAQVAFRLVPGKAGPWLGAFGGFEALSFEQGLDTRAADQALRGWELGAQGGIDFAWGPIVLGPYVTFSFGRFTVLDLDLGDVGSPTFEIPDEATHRWLQLGLRFALAL